MSLGRLLGKARADIAGEITGVGFIRSLVDSFIEEVPVGPTDNSLRDEDDDFVQSLQVLLVADTLGLIPAEAAGVVH